MVFIVQFFPWLLSVYIYGSHSKDICSSNFINIYYFSLINMNIPLFCDIFYSFKNDKIYVWFEKCNVKASLSLGLNLLKQKGRCPEIESKEMCPFAVYKKFYLLMGHFILLNWKKKKAKNKKNMLTLSETLNTVATNKM